MANDLIDRHCFYTRVAITTLQESYLTKHAKHERKRLMNIANHMMFDVFRFTCPLKERTRERPLAERVFSPQYVELYDRYMECLTTNGIDPTDGDFNLVEPILDEPMPEAYCTAR